MFIQVEATTTESIAVSGSWSHCWAGMPKTSSTSLNMPYPGSYRYLKSSTEAVGGSMTGR